MGRVLQIRVMAYTYDPGELERQWPRLYKLAFPTTGESEHDMREMIGSLADQVRFGALDSRQKSLLVPEVEQVEGVLARMDYALGEWDPREANKISEELEEALDQMEREVKKVL